MSVCNYVNEVYSSLLKGRVFWSCLVCFVGSPALCRDDSFIKAYVGLPWHDAGFQAALEGTCQEKNAKILN